MRFSSVSIFLWSFFIGVFYAPFAFSSAGSPACATYESKGALAIGDRCGNAVYVGSINGEQLYAEATGRREKRGWAAATATCADLGRGWRVPNKSELKLLFDHRDSGALAGTLDSGRHWSSSRATGISTPWILDFSAGEEGIASDGNRFAFRCVWSQGME